MFLLSSELSVYDIILLMSLMVLAGMYIGRFAEKYRIPNVTGYLFLGILTGGILVFFGHTELTDLFILLTTICLGFIAFSIGLELDFSKLKKRRREVLIITLTQAFMTFAVTAAGLFIFNLDIHIALLLGAVAIATEPGPILQLTKHYNTKGDLTDTLVPLHGIEDAFAILVFGTVLAYVTGAQGEGSSSWISYMALSSNLRSRSLSPS